MEPLPVPSSELSVRARLLDDLLRADVAGRQVVSADQFRAALGRQGLRFGEPAVDRVMLQCIVDASGSVSFSAFAEDVRRRQQVAAFGGAGGYGGYGPAGAAYGRPPTGYSDRSGGGASAGTAEALGTGRDSRGVAWGTGAPAAPGYGSSAGSGSASGSGTGSGSGGIGAGGMASSSYEFRSALEATTGARLVPTSLPPELASLPQPERVRALARELSALFTQLDTNRMSLDTFRARLRDMGLQETPEVTRLLHQPPIKFSVLYRALQADPVAGPTGGAGSSPSKVELFRPAGSSFPRGGNAHAPVSSYSARAAAAGGPAPDDHIPVAGRAFTTRPGSPVRSFNPVTGEGVRGANETASMRLDRSATVGPLNTAVVGDIGAFVGGGGDGSDSSGIAGRHGMSKAREDRSALTQESGAGAIIFGRGEVAAGADYGPYVESGYKFDRHCYKMGRGSRGDKELLTESGAGRLLRASGGPDDLPPDARFESTTQATQRTGLYGKADALHRPPTSAGYRTADRGLLREQIHSAVRLLDGGRINSRQFRARLTDIGVDLPPAVDRLLQTYDSNGKVDFPRFVRAFEDFLDAKTAPDPDAATTAGAAGAGTAPEPAASAAGPAGAGAAYGTASSSAAGARPPLGRRGDIYGSEPGMPGSAGAGAGAGGHGPAGSSSSSVAIGTVDRRDMVIVDDSRDLTRPLRPGSAYAASGDTAQFTRGGTSGGAFYSPHIDPAHRGHGDILGWSMAPTTAEAEQLPPRRPAPDRRLYDTYSPSIDIASVEQRAHFADAVHLHTALGSGHMDPRFRDLTSRRNLNPERHRDHGNIIAPHAAAAGAGAGGRPGSAAGSASSGPESEAQLLDREHAMFAGRGRARVPSTLAEYERSGPEPWAHRRM